MHCITLLFTILLNNLKKNLHDTTTLENFGNSIEKKTLFEWAQSDNTKTTIPSHNFMVFYVFKMAVAIAFLCENAVEAI